MAFVFDLGLLGLLLGLLAAQIVCAIVMMIVLARTDWKVQAERARELIGGINSREKVGGIRPNIGCDRKPESLDQASSIRVNFDKTPNFSFLVSIEPELH
ncbi:hypothetical protein VNO77_25294 [Canavalia gladiata]|uniref:Protein DETOXIFICATION n=1 Tax=Canavalia gladiata TaxID=3824 RepID=A0AAN9L8G3_CANGL